VTSLWDLRKGELGPGTAQTESALGDSISIVGTSISSLNSKKVLRNLTLKLDGDDDKLAASASDILKAEASMVDEFERFSIMEDAEPA
jgi:hypothetical protein